MGIALASIFQILLDIFSVLLHLACAAAIVVFFLLRLNTQDESKKRLYLTLMILTAIFLVGSLIARPILLILGFANLFA